MNNWNNKSTEIEFMCKEIETIEGYWKTIRTDLIKYLLKLKDDDQSNNIDDKENLVRIIIFDFLNNKFFIEFKYEINGDDLLDVTGKICFGAFRIKKFKLDIKEGFGKIAELTKDNLTVKEENIEMERETFVIFDLYSTGKVCSIDNNEEWFFDLEKKDNKNKVTTKSFAEEIMLYTYDLMLSNAISWINKGG